jgi:peptide/nickel transport system permease protein
MATFVARRLLYSTPVILLATVVVFVFVRETTDPTARLRAGDKAAVARERERLHLDDPLPVQYGKWLKEFVAGDWGESSVTNSSVTEAFRRAFWNTFQLVAWGILLSALIAIAIGVYSALRQYSVLDYTFTGLSFVGLAMPPFFFGILAIQFFVADPKDWFGLDEPLLYSVGLHSPGESGFNLDYLRHLALPVLTLCVAIIASWSRYQLGGVIIVEKIFSIDGMGRLFFDALRAGDVNVLLPWLVVSGAFIVAFNLLADVLYSFLDPRVRLT